MSKLNYKQSLAGSNQSYCDGESTEGLSEKKLQNQGGFGEIDESKSEVDVSTLSGSFSIGSGIGVGVLENSEKKNHKKRRGFWGRDFFKGELQVSAVILSEASDGVYGGVFGCKVGVCMV